MPRCIRCGKVYSSKFISGVCDDCAGSHVATKPAKRSSSAPAPTRSPQAPGMPEKKRSDSSNHKKRADSSGPDVQGMDSSSDFSVSKYEEEVARVSKQPPPPKLQRNRGFNTVSLLVFVLLMFTSVGLTYIGFGFTKHFAIWSVALVFFFLGAAMIVTKRLIVARSEMADLHDKIEPAAATSIGGMCLLPLIMCTFYYSFSTDLPSDRALWMVGGMSFLAFLALAGVAFALSRTPDQLEYDRT
jgi:hypothetical protein